jgi:hypothetical protein
MEITWPRALAWRLRQQLLVPVGTRSVVDVVSRLGALPAQSDTELAVRLRRRRSRPGEVADALVEGSLIKTFAFRGATHLMTPYDASALLALRASSRMWELPSWQSYYGLAPSDWPPLREAVREALSDGPLTPAQLGEVVTRRRKFAHLGAAFTDKAATFLKPFAWQGDYCFASVADGGWAFQRLDQNARWPGLAELDDAGLRAVEAYVTGYGPVTRAQVQYWLGEGLGAPRKRIQAWVDQLGDRLAEVLVGDTPALVRRDDVPALAATEAADEVRLLPGHDQWVLGPGTADAHVVPPDQRRHVTKGTPLVIRSGVVSGIWAVRRDRLQISWFADRKPPVQDLREQAGRVADLLGRAVEIGVEMT